jgi:succinyl-CoA synthetase beta subunit
MVGSSEGGMDIEAVAASTPELIFKYPIDITKGPQESKVRALAENMGFDSEDSVDQATKAMMNLYELFTKTDATLVEINPFAETHDGKVLILDAKLNFDDNAAYRQKEIFALRDDSQIDESEVIAEQIGLNYIRLDGDIGCLVNGAGLAMATMDAIKLNGGDPANFLDMGGGATAPMVTEAMKLLQNDPQVKAVLVNIFGGIMRCDVIALGLISAANTLGLSKPVVVRLAGTNVDEAVKLIEESGMRMLTATDLHDAAEKAVRVSKIVEMANQAHLGVEFQLPL